MLRIGIDVSVQDASALSSDLVIGPPGPATIALYLRSLLYKMGDPAVTRFAYGYAGFQLTTGSDGAMAVKRQTRVSTDLPTTLTEAGKALKHSYRDEAWCNFRLTILADVDVEPADVDGFLATLASWVRFNPLSKGVVVPERVCVFLASVKDGLQPLVDRTIPVDLTHELREQVGRFNYAPIDVLCDLAFRPPADGAHLKGNAKKAYAAWRDQRDPAYLVWLAERRWRCPAHIGYASLMDFAEDGPRHGRPHTYVETITGLVEYLPCHAASRRAAANGTPNFAFWRIARNDSDFPLLMEKCNG